MHVRHGFTMADLHTLAIRAVYDAHWTTAASAFGSFGERYDWVLAAIVEHLYSSEEPPEAAELSRAGQRAMRLQVEDEYRTHGINYKLRDGERHEAHANMRNFRTFWWDHSGNTASPENRIVDSFALRQIWPRLHWRHRRILMTLAIHGDHESAASALGKPMSSFRTELSLARKEFLRFWHEGEIPSRVWGRTTRIDADPGSRHHSITVTTIRKKRRRARKAEAPNGGRDA